LGWRETWGSASPLHGLAQIFFSRGEQLLLLAALSARTDQELSDHLVISPSTIKNTWRSIYNRSASRLPEMFLDHSPADVEISKRGSEKRRHLLAFLREHPEELRPVSRKLLRQAGPQRRQPALANFPRKEMVYNSGPTAASD
jgi:hypothetical protein